MVGRLGTMAARQALTIAVRLAVTHVTDQIRDFPARFKDTELEAAVHQLQTAKNFADVILDSPQECQRFVASVALTIEDARRSLDSSLSVRRAAKRRDPEA